MDRKTFIKTSCITCVGMSFLGTVIQSCVSVKYTTGNMNKDGILLDLQEFRTRKEEFRSYVIVRHDDLKYPICVYRIDEAKYSAVLMQCTHQGAELQVAGDMLTCPAHGSEFNKLGKVTQLPASEDLRSFPVTIENDKLFIDLRKKV